MNATAHVLNDSRRETVAAVAASILLHLLFIVFIAMGLTIPRVKPPLPQQKNPIEITILPPEPIKPTTPQFIRTHPQENADVQPKNASFESDNNTRAASEISPSGDQALPSVEGREIPGIEMESHDYTAGPQIPAAAPVAQIQNVSLPRENETSKPSSTPVPKTQLALLEAPKPTPTAETNPARPTQPRPPAPSGYQPETRVTRLRGNISNRGKASVEAAATPLGRYKKNISEAIGSRWYYYVNNQMGLLNIGTVTVQFVVNPDGKVRNVKVISNTSNESFASVSINAIMEAEIPPIPQEVAKLLENGRIEIDYSFTILSN